MKKINLVSLLLCATMVFGGCGSMSNTAKGGLIGAGGGALLGGIVGKIAGNTAIGAAVGAAVGTGAGVIIGKKMDKAKAEAEKVQNAKVEEITDANGLKAVKVSFDSGILFATGKANLNAAAKNSLTNFAGVLKNNSDMDVAVYGHTDNTGSDAINNPLSLKRAQSVQNFLLSNSVASKQFKSVEGKGSTDPVADNSTAAGKQANRRVEVYMYASEAMIKSAEAQAK